ncbi:MAG: ferrous iron transport protein A [Chloroflexaceae bacterium]|jgi:ferrous iron transport protein A
MNGRLDRLLTLSLVAPGQRVRVVEITADQPVSHRLHELGIVRGATLSVVQDDGGALLIAVGDTRLGLARGLAHRVRVLLEEEHA